MIIEPADLVTVHPDAECGTAVLVLAGSSGRVDVQRAELLARQGAVATAMRWFGGAGQQPGPYEVPLEMFTDALDQLAGQADRIAVMGTSFGAEAALPVARDPRVEAVVALAPSSVVWAGIRGDGSATSHWTSHGSPLPWVSFRPFPHVGDLPSYHDLYALSLAAAEKTDEAERAAIEVERIAGEVVLVAGGDDRVWPSTTFADRIAQRRSGHGLDTCVVSHPRAGHRTVLPGERPAEGGVRMARGGDPVADAELGQLAWPHIKAALQLH
ncbi:acyl-CoA thioester hydrolase/BAAT C-terminal domain-containing protein [Propionibacteriaceae bacterium Y1685]